MSIEQPAPVDETLLSPGGRNSLQLPPGHLQLRGKVAKALRRHRITTIEEARTFARSENAECFPYKAELITALDDLAACTTDDRTDWRAFWRRRGHRFEQLCATLPELDALGEKAHGQPVDRATFGNAGAMLQRAGYDDLGKLRDGLATGIHEVPGLGRGKLQAFFRRLLEVAAECRNSSSAASAAEGQRADSDLSAQEQDPLRGLPDCARTLPIGVLHLGSKTRWLKGEGFGTIGDLIDAAPSRLRHILAVGPRTRQLVEERLLCLASATDASGVDWDRYCAAAGVTLIPSDGDITSGEDLLGSLPKVIAELGEHCDGTDRDILLTRLSRPPREQSTLEEIAGRCRPIVTRERIRQREAKLLRQVGGVLLHEDGESTDLHFRPSFSGWWRKAASEFSGVEEIGFDEFVSRLSRVWNVTVPALTQELPFILAIVTGEPQMPADFRTAVRVSPLLYGQLGEDVRAIPLRHLRFRRRARWLTRRGVMTLGDLLGMLGSVSLPQEVLDHLNTIAECLADDGSFSWSRYRGAVTTETVPSEPPADAPAFTSGCADTFRAILERVRVPGRAVDIFELRTRHPPGSRKTLDATARLLGAHGPSIKREETVLLEELHKIVVEQMFSELGFWLDETWLRFCRDAHGAYESANGDHDRFVSGLCLRWAVTPRQVEAALPSLWAVFSGYPDRRREAGDEPDTGPAAAQPPARICLRGFRTVH